MKLKKIVQPQERDLFISNLHLSRSIRKGGGFREIPQSKLGEIHLTYGDLWALYDDTNQMIAGVVLHDLATLPASYNKPDFSHLPPEKVIEGSELWSLTPGAGLLLQQGVALLGLRNNIECFYAYVPVTPIDLRKFYLGFYPLSEVFLWPWVITDTNEKTFAQAMGLLGNKFKSFLSHLDDEKYIINDASTEILYSPREDSLAHVTKNNKEKEEIRKMLHHILQDRLHIDFSQISDEQDMQKYGIDSMIAIDLLDELEKATQTKLPLDLFYENQTINALSERIAVEKEKNRSRV
jgi:acyl carrier protein